jgi:hypothetical protein
MYGWLHSTAVRSFRDEAAAVHIFQADASGSFATVRGHIASCPQCAGANAQHVWHILTAWARDTAATRARARR